MRGAGLGEPRCAPKGREPAVPSGISVILAIYLRYTKLIYRTCILILILILILLAQPPGFYRARDETKAHTNLLLGKTNRL